MLAHGKKDMPWNTAAELPSPCPICLCYGQAWSLFCHASLNGGQFMEAIDHVAGRNKVCTLQRRSRNKHYSRLIAVGSKPETQAIRGISPITRGPKGATAAYHVLTGKQNRSCGRRKRPFACAHHQSRNDILDERWRQAGTICLPNLG
jgi:hypothetical protein